MFRNSEELVVTDFIFERPKLKKMAQQLQGQFKDASPFSYIVIDDFLPVPVLDKVLEEFPQATDIKWNEFKTAQELKLANSKYEQFPENTRHILNQFNSAPFCEFLEELTGIEGIIPDPHFHGGGLHQIQTGGYLKIHADFNLHQKLRLDRRLNVLIYLNKDWEESYGGHLELWERDMSKCAHRVLPVFNRCVVFETTSDSFHGHPDPLTCPPNRSRRSLALYYYTNGRPEEQKKESHNTLFRQRPGERLKKTSKDYVRWFVPPVLLDFARLLRTGSLNR